MPLETRGVARRLLIPQRYSVDSIRTKPDRGFRRRSSHGESQAAAVRLVILVLSPIHLLLNGIVISSP